MDRGWQYRIGREPEKELPPEPPDACELPQRRRRSRQLRRSMECLRYCLLRLHRQKCQKPPLPAPPPLPVDPPVAKSPPLPVLPPLPLAPPDVPLPPLPVAPPSPVAPPLRLPSPCRQCRPGPPAPLAPPVPRGSKRCRMQLATGPRRTGTKQRPGETSLSSYSETWKRDAEK